MLCSCLGGTVAQQIARSIATSVADKTIARAMDVEDGPSNRQATYSDTQLPAANPVHTASLIQPYKPVSTTASNQDQANKNLANRNTEIINSAKRSMQEIEANPYTIAIANTAFLQVNAEELRPIAEPLPTQAADTEHALEVIQSSQLVRVELFNLLIGEEKNAVYEQARLMGSISLPQKREWALWQVAVGAIQPNNKQPDKKVITFLIPPEFGKLPSGAVTMVELASPGELNVARYKAN